MMSKDIVRSAILRIAVRFATWMLPPNSKEWAEAMLYELAYIQSRRAALSWVLGCIFSSIKARAAYALVGAFAPRKMLNALLSVGVASVVLATSIYMVQKPYQRERIVAVVCSRWCT
jgi:hypothetical protein